jgi:hypothetical protein
VRHPGYRKATTSVLAIGKVFWLLEPISFFPIEEFMFAISELAYEPIYVSNNNNSTAYLQGKYYSILRYVFQEPTLCHTVFGKLFFREAAFHTGWAISLKKEKTVSTEALRRT